MVDQLAAGLVGGLDGVLLLQTHMKVGYTQADVQRAPPTQADASPDLSSIPKPVAQPVALPLFSLIGYIKT